MNSKSLSVIIVSYNSEEFIEACISSVLKFLPMNGELIVVDNASTDKSALILKTFLPKITLIESDQNLGFGRGNNLAAKSATGKYLFFLNPDTRIEKPIFGELIKFYQQTKNIGIVAPKLKLPNGKVQESVKKLPTVWGAVKEFIFGIKNSYSQYVPITSIPLEVESVYGAALLIKTDLFKRLGGFDEKYFMYYEDADFCRRIKKMGLKTYYYPGVEVFHLVGGTKSNVSKYKLNYESSKKYHGLIGFIILQIIFRLRRLLS